MAELDAKNRFTDRVKAYRRARPSYPPALIDRLLEAVPEASPRVAELGSGTGIFTGLLLDRGCRVWAVEPNRAMRTAAERDLGAVSGFTSVDGSAESTGLPEASVDLVVSAQAFHWFDFERTRTEVTRVLRPTGTVAWAWNWRRSEASAFSRELERFLEEWSTDYEAVRKSYRVRERLADFLPDRLLEQVTFEHHQILDREGLRTRVLSASYMPRTTDRRYSAMLEALDRLVDEHQIAGLVRLELDCELIWTRPA